jgi:hypothetical protein
LVFGVPTQSKLGAKGLIYKPKYNDFKNKKNIYTQSLEAFKTVIVSELHPPPALQ